MSEHTPGRLSVTPLDDDEYAAAIMGPDCDPYPLPIADVHSEGNARRLVACWNVCEGIGTNELESGGGAAVGWARAASKLIHTTRQRDELLKALREVSDVFGVDWREGSTQRRLGDLARAAIAKATGGQT